MKPVSETPVSLLRTVSTVSTINCTRMKPKAEAVMPVSVEIPVETVEIDMRFQNEFLISNRRAFSFGSIKQIETGETGNNCL